MGDIIPASFLCERVTNMSLSGGRNLLFLQSHFFLAAQRVKISH